MLVIDNGAFKSGSSWLYQIICRIKRFEAPPAKYLNPNWVHPSISPDKLKEILENLDYSKQDFLVKNHFNNKKDRDLILSYPDIKVVCIVRDIRDVVVSAYYHLLRKEKLTSEELISFKAYYWKRGRLIALNVLKYNNYWSINSENIYIAKYENLLENPSNEIKIISRFLLDRELSETKTQSIITETNFVSMKQKRSDGFLRKGISGDHKNYFDSKMLEDIEKIENNKLIRYKIKSFKRMKSRLRSIYSKINNSTLHLQ